MVSGAVVLVLLVVIFVWAGTANRRQKPEPWTPPDKGSQAKERMEKRAKNA